jgi:hypothetical protein
VDEVDVSQILSNNQFVKITQTKPKPECVNVCVNKDFIIIQPRQSGSKNNIEKIESKRRKCHALSTMALAICSPRIAESHILFERQAGLKNHNFLACQCW